MSDWIVLNQVFNDEAATLQWFDQAKNQPKHNFAQESELLADLLIRNNRLADVANFIYQDPVQKLKDAFRLSQNAKESNRVDNAFVREAVTLYLCCLAAHLDAKAEQVAKEALQLQNTTQLRKQLVLTAYKLHLLTPFQLKWLDALQPAGDTNFYLQRGGLYCEIAQYERAVKDFDLAIGTGQKDPQIYCSRGTAHFKLHHEQKAMDDFNAAAQLAPKNAWVWLNKGAAEYSLKKYNDAYSDAGRAIELDPTNMDGFCNRAEAALRLGKFPEALADLTKCLDSPSKSCQAEAHYYRALAYEKLGNSQLAKQDRVAATTMGFKPGQGE